MRALTFHGKQDIRHETVTDPRIQSPGDVIVRIELAAICGSDLHPYFEREKGLDHGTVMGHEAVGIVEEIGSEVALLKKGDRVFSPFSTNCGSCFYCRRGLTCRCTKGQLYGWVEKGAGLQGLQAEAARVPFADCTLMKVPQEISREEALLLGDVLSTGYFAAEQAEITSDGVYAVIGCGPVGLMAVFGAKQLGATRVYAIDPVLERRSLAESFGAIGIDPVKQDAGAILQQATDGRGADAVMEGVGSAEAERLAFDLVRPGGIISTVGVHNDAAFTFSPPEAYNKNLIYKVGRCPARHYMEKLLPLVRSRKHDFSALLSHRMPLADGPGGYRLFADRKESCTKVLLVP